MTNLVRTLLRWARALSTCFLLIIWISPADATVRLNEIVASNSLTVADEDGDFEDWIELYNPGSQAVDLSGWGLSDSYGNPFKWTFPNGTWIGPNAYLLVWASGKDRKPEHTIAPENVPGMVLHLRGDTNQGLADGDPVFEWTDISGMENHAAQPAANQAPSHTEFAVNSMPAVSFVGSDRYLLLPTDDFSGLENLREFTIITLLNWNGGTTAGIWGKRDPNNSANNAHFEIEFGGRLRLRVADIDFGLSGALSPGSWDIVSATVNANADQPFAALFRNGTEIISEAGDPGPAGFAGDDAHFIGASHPTRSFDGAIAEFLFYNRSLSEEERRDVELYLHSRYTPTGFLHTNFSISGNGEEVILTRPDGTLADEFPPMALPRDYSAGRVAGEGDTWFIFTDPTPGETNTTQSYLGILDPPAFSHSPGFHAEAFDLTLDAPEDTVIRYTLDGSEPTDSSPVWPGSLTVSETGHGPGVLSRIQTTPPVDLDLVAGDHVAQLFKEAITWMVPESVETAFVLRAKAFQAGYLTSRAATTTYWVGESVFDRHTLPVVSIHTDAPNFFDPDYGIYVPGDIFNNSNPSRPWHSGPANYRMRGIEWERPIHIAFFSPDGTSWTEQDAGVRLHGGATRSMQQKGLRLYARGDYGKTRFEYPFFDDMPDDSFNRLLLRGSGNDWNLTLFRDALAQRVVGHMRFDTQAYRPMVAYLNGEYWGIHNLRERFDKHYLERHHGIDPENIDLLTGGGASAVEGNRTHYLALMNLVNNEDITSPSVHAEVGQRMDIENFIDYFIGQIFTGNTDWPGNNIDFWRQRNEYDPDAPAGQDGRWRWLAYDLDFGYGYAFANNAHAHDTLGHARNNHTLFRRLLDNPTFREQFIIRFSDQLNTAFLPARIAAVLDEMEAAIAPEIPHHIARWLRPPDADTWGDRVEVMRTFAENRSDHVWNHIQGRFDLSDRSNLTILASGEGVGAVRVNSIRIDSDTIGLANPAQPFPWTSSYFRNIPMDVEAIPAAGHRFAGWITSPGGDVQSTESILAFSLSGDTTFEAVFEPLSLAELPIALHEWDFEDAATLLEPSFTLGGGALSLLPGPTTEAIANTGGDFETQHLRLNNPLGATLTFSLPTTGYGDIVFELLTRRSGQGAGLQTLSYTTDGENWSELNTYTVFNSTPQFHTFDFSGIPETSDNPDFAVSITFEQGEGGIEGNNRFDDVALYGTGLPGTVIPPIVNEEAIPERITLAVPGDSTQLNLEDWFTHPNDADMTLQGASSDETVLAPSLDGSFLTLIGSRAGGVTVTVQADDGVNPAVETSFDVLVYPEPLSLTGGNFTFDFWSPDEPAGSFPQHMLFLQSDTDDPGLDTDLLDAYHIPADDSALSENVDFPYSASNRSRINGLGESGISFINTGRGRDVGSALVALDTTGASEIDVSWTAGTVTPNSRVYGLRLQYRIGIDAAWADLPGMGSLEYVRDDVAGHEVEYGPVRLPEELEDQTNLQLQWRYYHISGDSGRRAEIRLDDVRIISAAHRGETFSEWVSRVFPDLSPEEAQPEFDPNGEGIPLLLRYALDPGEGTSGGLSLPVLEVAGESLVLRFRRDTERADIAYVVEAGTTLAHWDEVLYDSRIDLHENTDGEWMTVVDSVGFNAVEGRRFLRLRVLLLEGLDDG